MSHYSEVKVKLVRTDLLAQVLRDQGFTLEVHEKPVILRGFFGTSDNYAHIVARKTMNRRLGLSADLGFLKTADGHQLYMDDMDMSPAWIAQVTQAYSRLVVAEKMAEQGLVLKEEVAENGSICLTYVREVYA